MSSKNPIPTKLRHEFVGYVSKAEDKEAPDGVWFARIQQAAMEFMNDHGLRGCENRAAYQYLRLKNPSQWRRES